MFYTKICLQAKNVPVLSASVMIRDDLFCQHCDSYLHKRYLLLSQINQWSSYRTFGFISEASASTNIYTLGTAVSNIAAARNLTHSL